MSLSTLSPEVSCFIADTCSGLSCCVNNHFLQRTFEVTFRLDPCENRLSIGIENTMYNRTLTDFNWGRENLLILCGDHVLVIWTKITSISNLYSMFSFVVLISKRNRNKLLCYTLCISITMKFGTYL